jgi:hypothetical protein
MTMGLLWMLQGERVVDLTATEAMLSGGLTFYQRIDRIVVETRDHLARRT